MKFKHIRGLVAAPFTPMYEDGRLNLSLIPEYYHMLKANGVVGAFICGSTGEGVSMTCDEKKAVIAAWGEATKDDTDFIVMPLLGGTSIQDCKELAVYAQAQGMEAISFTAPFYFKPADVRQLALCCKEVADAVPDLPFYYYHIPVLNGVGFAMYDLLQAVDGIVPNFAGVKYTHEDFMDYMCCVNYKDGRYDMLWGRDENMLPAMSVGAKGAVGSTFNYAAPLYYEIIEAYEKSEFDTARKLQQQSIDMIRLLGKYGGIATGKAYMKVLGLDCGEFRLPVKNMSADEFEMFKKDVEAVGFKSFCSKIGTLVSQE